MKNFKIFNLSCLLLFFTVGCKKFVAVPAPSTSITGTEVFSTNANAEAAMNGIYVSMTRNSFGGGINGVSVLPGLSADELSLFPGAQLLQQQVFIDNQLSDNNLHLWSDAYQIIYQANAAISGIPESISMTPAVKNQFLGEALFIRAYCYFYLVNFYGDVPLVTTITYQNNAGLPRTAKKIVYQQIITDLTQAESLLADAYLDGSGSPSSERVRPNKEAVAALLARIYLYTGDWKDAVTQSTQVITSGIYELSTDLNQVFLANSAEAIWQLELPSNQSSTSDGSLFLYPLLYGNPAGPNAGNPVYLSRNLATSFETGDLRKKSWVDSVSLDGTTYYYPYKYKQANNVPPPLEYPMMLRYAELFLIRAEAYAHENQPSFAVADLNTIRSRAGLHVYVATDTASVFSAIMQERRVEFFAENGHRWFDLERSGMIDAIMKPACAAKGGTWNSYDQLYPIPESEIQADPHLVQNPGYK